MHITIRIIRILSSLKCSAIDIPDEDITMFENKQSGYNNYIDRMPLPVLFMFKNKQVILSKSNQESKESRIMILCLDYLKVNPFRR